MATIIAVSNQKGGCGKTTTCMNLAGGLTALNYRILVIDADPQASATFWSLARGQGSLPFDVQTARQIRGRFQGLVNLDYDIILIDCPPGVADSQDEAGKFARLAIKSADAILVPLRPSTLDFSAAATFVRYLAGEKDVATRVAVVINGKQHTVLGRQAHAQAQVLFAPIEGAKVLETSIGLRAPITEVSGSGKTIFDYAAPSHEAVREYTNLTKEFLTWLSQNEHPSPLSQTTHLPASPSATHHAPNQ